eukprot:3535078-Rhodomonas_salina.1
MQGAVGGSVKRGKLLPGWRPIIKMKKLLREWRRTEHFLSTAHTEQVKIKIKHAGLTKADSTVLNLRCLESLLFTSLVEFEVKNAVWSISEKKTIQCSMRYLADLGGRSVGSAASARFQIMQHWRDYVVIDAGKPEEFTSFNHLKIEAGGLGNLVDEALFRKALKMDEHDPIEAVHMAEYCCRSDKCAAP